MFGVGTSELLIIFLVALLVIGPSKLPEVARALGKALAEFRKVSTDVKRQIDLEVQLADLEKTTPPQNKDNSESNEISSKNIEEKREDTPPSDNQQKWPLMLVSQQFSVSLMRLGLLGEFTKMHLDPVINNRVSDA